ncbi:MAG TPA: triose-phosphate isomerase [Phycisphaerales bacterium]|nr:triose-phosphate isomerase [Phycisphaerales bacterium]
MTRQPLVGGNWKMNLNAASGQSLAAGVAQGLESIHGHCDVVLFPPFPYLLTIAEQCGSAQLGGQDVSQHQQGAHTSEVSGDMLVDCGCTTALVGHSERRQNLGETNEMASNKVHAALDAGLRVLLCVGETLEARQAGHTREVVLEQLAGSLQGINSQVWDRIDLAYEPVWAIGTGQTAGPEQAQEVHAILRTEVESRYDARSAGRTRILYGGSVKPSNTAELMACGDVDGVLVGGASLEAESFLDIVRAVART